MADRIILCVGTKKGLFVFSSKPNRDKWRAEGPFLKEWQIYHAILDSRGTPKFHVATSSDVFGTTIMSGNFPKPRFKGAKKPPIPPKLSPKQMKMARQWHIPTSEKVWHIEPGHKNERNVLFAGTAPAGLFKSVDGGRTWKGIEGLNNHPTRKFWAPGAGGMCLHSIQLDPFNSDRMYVAISASGVFRTDDGGRKWKPVNKGASGFPGSPKKTEVESCVHKFLIHPAMPERLYQQNHVGVYKSDNHGDLWQKIDKGLPYNFGFGLALHPLNPDTCYVAPLEPSEGAFRATTGKFRVYKFNGNRSGWKELGRGLPSTMAYIGLKREGLASDAMNPCGIYAGTSDGTIFYSRDEGKSWNEMVRHLPEILSVSTAVL